MTVLIETTLHVSVTALFILLFKQIFKNRLPAKWHVFIWLLLAVRVVIPVLPESSFSVFNAFDMPENRERPQSAFVKETAKAVDASDADTPYENEYDSIIEAPSDESVSKSVPEQNKQPLPFLPKAETEKHMPSEFWVHLIWGCGTGILFIYFVVVYTVNALKIKKNKKYADDETLLVLEECKRLVGVKRKASLAHYGKSPMLMGAVRPVIIIPEDYSLKDKRNIIIHELCHLKNGDIYSLWAAAAVLCLNWYNPVIWFSFFTFRRDIEVYCDRRVLEYTDSKKEYAELLVKTALKKNSFIAGTTSLQNGEKEVERRIKYMAYFKKPGFIWIAVIAVAAVLISVICLTNATDDKKEPENTQNSDYAGYTFDTEQCKALVNIRDGCGINESIQLLGSEFRYIVYHIQSHMSSEELTPKHSYYNVFVFRDDILTDIIEADSDTRVYGYDIANTVLEADMDFDGKNDILICTPDLGFEEYDVYLQADDGIKYCGRIEKMQTVHVNTKAKIFSGIYDHREEKTFRINDGKIEYLDYVDYIGNTGYKTIDIHKYGGVEKLENADDIIDSTPNFLLEDRGDYYYFEVFDNDGNILLSETSERYPEFNHLTGNLYELKTGMGTFAWQSRYFDVETGWKSELYNNSFYLSNGVIAYVNNIAVFTDNDHTKDGELTEIDIFDLLNQKLLSSIDAEFLKQSAVSYNIEYADDSHIEVTYYTENGNKENKKLIEIPQTGTVTKVSSLPIDGELSLLFAGGAGAWGDFLLVKPDGSFSGEYHDSDMGIADENEYPKGTVFIDRYSGKFGNFIKIDDYTYKLTVLEETHEFEPNAEWIEDGIRFISTSPENPDIGTEYVLCLPGKPLSEIPDSVKEWEFGNDSENTLTGYCLYPAKSQDIGYFEYT